MNINMNVFKYTPNIQKDRHKTQNQVFYILNRFYLCFGHGRRKGLFDIF